MHIRASLIATSLLLAPAAAPAQGLDGLLGGALPGLGSTGVGNAAGLLGYCLKNRLLGGVGAAGAGGAGSAAGILGKLTGKPTVTESPGYQLGQEGKVEQPGGGALPLDALSGKLKTKACNIVLKRAGSFL